MKVLTFAIVVILLSILNGCKEEIPTITTGSDSLAVDLLVDPLLVGTWSSDNVMTLGYIPVRGIEIGFDKSVRLLGIETATGRLDRMEEGNGNELVLAKDGKIILKHNYCWRGYGSGDTIQMRYQVAGENLFLSNVETWWIHSVMHRTQLGSIIAQPSTVMLSAKIDGRRGSIGEVKNFAVAAFPSAYVSKTSPSRLILHADLSYPWESIDVQIDNFTGQRGYGLDMDKAEFRDFCNDQGGFDNYAVDSSTHSVIFIDEYNLKTHRCSGRFVLDFYFDYYYDHNYVYRLTEGVFSVPIIDASQSSQLPESVLRRGLISHKE